MNSSPIRFSGASSIGALGPPRAAGFVGAQGDRIATIAGRIDGGGDRL